MNKPTSTFRMFARSADGLAAWCIPCHKVASREHYLANREKINANAVKWAQQNSERIREIQREFHHRNKDARAMQHKCWAKKNTALRRAIGAKRKAAKLRATPKWVDLNAIKDVYRRAVELQKMTGMRMHVDHIVPLQSHIVCGLHCLANLQVIPGADNESKKNYWWPDMPEDAYKQGVLIPHEAPKFEQEPLI